MGHTLTAPAYPKAVMHPLNRARHDCDNVVRMDLHVTMKAVPHTLRYQLNYKAPTAT